MTRGFILVILATVLAAPAGRVAAADAPLATVTILEGQAQIYRAVARLQAVEGVRLAFGDIVETTPQTFAQLEFADRSVLQIGGATRLMLGSVTSGRQKEKVATRVIYLMDGWLKLIGAKKDAKEAKDAKDAAAPFDLRSPLFEVEGGPAVLVVHVTPSQASLFVERERARLTERSEPPVSVTLEAGDSWQRAAGARGAVNPGGLPGFVSEMPRSFRDTLPLRGERYRDTEVQPKPAPDFAYADVETWLKSEPGLRRQFVQRWRSKARDGTFRSALVANLNAHPEWDPVLFPEKYKPKPPPPRPAPPPPPPAPPRAAAPAEAASDVAPSR